MLVVSEDDLECIQDATQQECGMVNGEGYDVEIISGEPALVFTRSVDEFDVIDALEAEGIPFRRVFK